jgi:geranylgeranyl pyrophosphate synthase
MSHPVTAVFPAPVLAFLDEVDQRLQKQGESREPRLTEWSQEPLGAGGKRIRPLLLLTAFDACLGGRATKPKQQDQALDAAVALELIHTASLVHDDIMDEAAQRRGKPSTYHAHGRDAAILVGDYLFTQAFALGTALPRGVMEMTADACRRLCEGQLREQRLQDEGIDDRSAYAAVIRDKTASLLAAACGIGAILAGSSQDQVDRMYRYGNAIGHAFQVLDDVLDVAGDPAWTGKPAGTDYIAGTHSSPFLHYKERGGHLPTDRRRQDFPGVRDKLFDTGAVAASQMEASTYTQDALLQLQSLPESASRAALEQLAELLMERVQ